MNLETLEQADKIFAKVMVRARQKAWNHFFWMQDLKVGEAVLITDIGLQNPEIAHVEQILEREYGFDIIVIAKTEHGKVYPYGLQITYAERGAHDLYVRLMKQPNPPMVTPLSIGKVSDALKYLRKPTELTNVLWDKQ